MISQKDKTLFKNHVLKNREIRTYDDIHDAIANISSGKNPGTAVVNAIKGAVLGGRSKPEKDDKALNKLKGDLFETFVHGMIMTDPSLRVVYAFKPGDNGDIDENRRYAIEKLGLQDKDQDNGIDLVFIDNIGRVFTVQDKYVTNTNASITYKAVTTFYDQSKAADGQVLVTSGARIDAENKSPELKGSSRIKIVYDDLISLSEDRIQQIIDYINKNSYEKRKKKNPRPDQNRALKNIKSGFSKGDRIQYISACGTGKTFVSSRFTSDVYKKGGDVVVFVPSLNLMKQTIESWADEFAERENFSFQAICSDNTVTGDVPQNGEENSDLTVEDLKYFTTTDVDTIKNYLNRPRKKDELKVTFCTYQSSPVLSEAIKDTTFKAFNLGILDEAHRTAVQGERKAVDESAFTYPLNDDRIPILQRMSMTATPRVMNIKKNNDEDDSYAYSMDNEETYGHVAHEYKFAEAVKDEVIVPFKIVISAVFKEDADRYNDALVKSGKSALNRDDAIKAIALKKAIEETGARNVVTYQSRTKDAEHLSKTLDEMMPENWNVNFVSGKMSAKERAQKVSILGQKNPAIITNSKVMTEGVDVPDIDMVAFVDNRESGIDIVQAVGRVTRKSANKETGYVVLPVVMDRNPGQSMEAAAESANYSTLYRVINALAAEDEDLMAVINEMASARGSGDEERIRDARNDLRRRIGETGAKELKSPEYLIMSETIDKIIETKIVKKLASFRTRVAELKKYLDNNEGIYPTYADKKTLFSDKTSIENWIKRQRNAYKAKTLSQDRISLLNSIGFKWEDYKYDRMFEQKFKELVQYLKDHGGKYPKQEDKKTKFLDGSIIGIWIGSQRTAYKAKTLPQNRIDLLNSIGFKWMDKEYEMTYEQKVEEFVHYLKINYGKYPISANTTALFSDGNAITRWISTQRALYNAKEMPQNRLELLNSIGFKWKSGMPFKEKIEELVKYLNDNDGRYPEKNNIEATFSDGSIMGGWISNQRRRYKAKTLPQNRIDLLSSIGFKWEPISFEEKVEEFVQYLKSNNGNYPGKEKGNVIAIFSDDTSIENWVNTQRATYKATEMPQDRIDLLNSIGFKWEDNKYDRMFEQKFKEFVQHLNDNGGDYPEAKDIKIKFSDGTRLGVWINTQRTDYKAKTLPQNRIDLLNSIGFKWEDDKYDRIFEQRFKEFVQHLNDHGGKYPTQKYEGAKFSDDILIGGWINAQRRAYKAKTLPQNRIDLLNSIGFEWDYEQGQKNKSTPSPRTPDNDEDDNRPSMSM